jgi:NRAMP (natural resistance-associated macrophage protein)-like metal ion transporter
MGLVLALAAVVGPGILAGLSDDDPAGITTYSVLGADYGYRLLWVVVASTGVLIYFHLLAVRLGAVTGEGFAALVRTRYSQRVAIASTSVLAVANFGTICAEYAGIAAVGSLAGVPALVSVVVAGVLVMAVVLLGSFGRVEHILLAVSASLAAYLIAGVLAKPDWTAALYGSVTPSMPLNRAAVVIVAAALGTTLAPWGLAFIQSYAVDKKLSVNDLGYERIDVVAGALLTGIIGVFIAIACAATLYVKHQHINDASDAAKALAPLAGQYAALLFSFGLLGAALLAAAIVPLSTAYSLTEASGKETGLDGHFRDQRFFYSVFMGSSLAAMGLVAVPGIPLIPLIVASQVLNAVLLAPQLVLLLRLSTDPGVTGEHAISPASRIVGWTCLALVMFCVTSLLVATAVPRFS